MSTMVNADNIELARAVSDLYRHQSIHQVSDDLFKRDDAELDIDDYDAALDELIAGGGFMTPQDYYGKQLGNISVGQGEQGYYNITSDQASGGDTGRAWFWVEDLRNWCSYEVDMTTHESTNIFRLYVWNGKNGWIPFRQFAADVPAVEIDRDYDAFAISRFQNKLLERLVFKCSRYTERKSNRNDVNVIARSRGTCQSVHSTLVTATGKIQRTNFPPEVRENPDADANLYFDFNQPMEVVNGFRLQKNVKYTINDQNSFQTRRWSSLAYQSNSDAFYSFTQSNSRSPVSTGVPTMWRLPTGELFLTTYLIWRGDNGFGYYYIKDGSLGGLFRKHYTSEICKDLRAASYKMLGNNNTLAAKWINKICQQFFTDGSDKTIEKDWLRLNEGLIYVDDRDYTNAYDNMLDSSKVYEQNNINKTNTMKCQFKLNRPVVTSEDLPAGDYVKKW